MNSHALKEAIESYLQEDIGFGDITTESIIASKQQGSACFIAKGRFVAAGLKSVAALVFKVSNPEVELLQASEDGHWTEEGEIILKVQGPLHDLLVAERTALNLAQRLCGIATLTARFVEKVKSLPVRIVDTRKTTPGLRMLEKYAVRVGGGGNHRFNLSDGILIKDNHIAACGSIEGAVSLIKARMPHTMKIEVEAETIDQVRECVTCGVDIIMLDNMSIDMMREAVELAKGRAILEASGGVDLINVREIATTGVDIISIGALTHSAPACDISMRLYPTD